MPISSPHPPIPERNTVIGYSHVVLTVDYVSRWISLGLYRLLVGNSFEVAHISAFMLVQVLLTAVTLGHLFVREFYFRKRYLPQEIPAYEEGEWFKAFRASLFRRRNYDVVGSAFSMFLRILYVLGFGYMFLNTLSDNMLTLSGHQANLNGILFTTGCFLYGALTIFTSFFAVPRRAEIALVPPREFKSSAAFVSEIVPSASSAESSLEFHRRNPIDRNDKEILDLESQIQNLLNRVEAYILESVMLGALAFSGFLTIVAADTDRINYRNLQLFGHNLVDFILDLLIFDFRHLDEYALFSTKPQHLLVLITFQTAVCAMFFLLVIAARLKFSSLAERITNVLSMARSLNTKEEEVYLLRMHNNMNVPFLNERLLVLHNKISRNVFQARKLIREILPVIRYMSLFRNLGVLLFLAIIISGLLFFHKTIAFFFMFLAAMAFVYKRIDDWYRKKRIVGILGQQSPLDELD